MQFPFASCPRNTLNPNVTLPFMYGAGSGAAGWPPAGSSTLSEFDAARLPVGSIRPPPVHFPVTHCAGGGVNQKLGRFGAMLTFGRSVHAAASSPAARRLGQTIRVPCSRIMAVLPSLLTIPAGVRFVSHAARPRKGARAVPATYRNESREGVRETRGVATSRRRAWGTDALRAPPTQQRRATA